MKPASGFLDAGGVGSGLVGGVMPPLPRKGGFSLSSDSSDVEINAAIGKKTNHSIAAIRAPIMGKGIHLLILIALSWCMTGV
jgi:hypothetical protein